MAELTEDQILTVQEKGKGADRPLYYSAIERKEVLIGDDFEAFAVLVEPDLREEIIDRLGESNEGDPTRQTLYAEALQFEEADAATRLVDLERAVAGFGTFRLRILGSPAGASTEVAPLVQDTQRGVGVASEQRERVYHELQAARVLTELNERQEGSQDEIRQRESWEGVLSAYRS